MNYECVESPFRIQTKSATQFLKEFIIHNWSLPDTRHLSPTETHRTMSHLSKTFLALGLMAGLTCHAGPATAAQPSVTSKAVPYFTEPVLSPDRKEIAFVSGGDIWTVPAGGGAAHLLVSHPATEGRPMYSPDGKKLAFTSTRTGNGDIYVLNLEDGDLKRITFEDGADQLDGWSRDGVWLYFSSSSRDISGSNDLYRVRAEGGTPMTITADRYTNEFNGAPSPDGKTIAFNARGIAGSQWWRKGHSHIDESEIWIRRDGPTPTFSALAGGGAKRVWPMWNSDGTRVFYVSDESGAQNIWAHPLTGKAAQLTKFTNGRVLWPAISNDGKQIVFEHDFHIWTCDTDTGKTEEVPIQLRGVASGPLVERVNLSSRLTDLALSPDGKKVAVIAYGEIFAASAKDGGEAVRVTKTAAPESFLVWSPDSSKLAYRSDRDGESAIFLYEFATGAETRISNGKEEDAHPVFSPDGKSLAYLRGGHALIVADLAMKQEREVCKLNADLPPILGKRAFTWSPDSKWIAYFSGSPQTRSYNNVFVVAAAGGTPQQISFLANSYTGALSWSPDGSFIVFDSAQRTESGQMARIDLRPRTPKFREDQFRDLFKQENPKERPQLPPASATPPASGDAKPEKKESGPNTEIVFDDIRRRLSVLSVGVDVGAGQSVSPDGKTLLISGNAEGQFNLYTFPLDELATDQTARQLTATGGFKADAQFSPDGKEVYYLENGRVFIIGLDKREPRPLSINVEMNVAFADSKMALFDQVWRNLRDHFYDENFHGANWQAVRATYEPLVAGARTPDEARRLMTLMVGELDASHLGVTGPPNPGAAAPVGHLGLRFDRAEYETNGVFKVSEIIALGPVAVAGGVDVGDVLESVDGIKLDARSNLDELLENKVNRRVELALTSSGGTNRRTVAVKPCSLGTEKGLVYRQWVEANRAYVAKASNGRLGYVHMPDMSANSLAQLYIDLDTDNQSKDGVVIDIRNNNGGFVNVYAIDVFARKGYLTMRERGGWPVNARTNLGQRSLERPSILMINQQSLSDAEDFTEGYRTLKLGKVVGEPTAGWIIYTWNTTLFDGTTLRLPRQLITGADGKNMERNPRPVDIPVSRPIGEATQGRDTQLDTAVRELLNQIDGK